jgi:hypothetical protein
MNRVYLYPFILWPQALRAWSVMQDFQLPRLEMGRKESASVPIHNEMALSLFMG